MSLRELMRLGRRRPVAVDQEIGRPVTASQDEVRRELHAMGGRLSDVRGLLVATVDGLLVAAVGTAGTDEDTVAAMAAAQIGLGQQIARAVSGGAFLENVTRTTEGYVAVFGAGRDALLAVIADSGLNLGRLQYEARPAAARIGTLLESVTDPYRHFEH
jgi:predicted regulator of Ras-like GTPase activity (Roadblock/LC7/MglB family)